MYVHTAHIRPISESNKDPASVDHTPHAHPVSPTHELPADFTSSKSSSPSFSSYRQQAQQHGPLGRNTGKSTADGSLGSHSGHSLGSVTPPKGEYFDRNELPARFRRTRIDISEIDAIETGGATLVCWGIDWRDDLYELIQAMIPYENTNCFSGVMRLSDDIEIWASRDKGMGRGSSGTYELDSDI